MPNKYIYSKRADQQVARIYRDTARDWGLSQADSYNEMLLKAVKMLADNPSVGRQCDDIKAGYRRFEVGRHVIFYRKRSTDIFIVQIIHDRMDVKTRSSDI